MAIAYANAAPWTENTRQSEDRQTPPHFPVGQEHPFKPLDLGDRR